MKRRMLGLIFFLKTSLARAWREAFGPVMEVDMRQVVDRLGNRIQDHELLALLRNETEETLSIEYHAYNKRMRSLQEETWLVDFIGKAKAVPYWLTPWGGSWKPYRDKHLTLEYSREYISRLRKIQEKIQKEGYHPEIYGYITGQLLVDEEGRSKFIVWNGHRRILSLANLGYQTVKVEISGGDRWIGKILNHTIRINDIRHWKNIKNGLYTEEEGISFFRRFFKSP